jgi:hypothetical protein
MTSQINRNGIITKDLAGFFTATKLYRERADHQLLFTAGFPKSAASARSIEIGSGKH